MTRDEALKFLLELPADAQMIYIADEGIAACIDPETPIPEGWKRGMLKYAHEWAPLVRIRKVRT